MEKENLLSSLDPSTNPEEFRKLFTRKVCDYEDKCDPFRIAGVANEYGRQYSHIYFARLSEMSEVVVQKAKKKWGKTESGYIKLVEPDSGSHGSHTPSSCNLVLLMLGLGHHIHSTVILRQFI